MATEMTVDDYIASLDEARGAIVRAVRDIVRGAAPGVREAVRWAQPVYEMAGPFAYIKAHSRSVNFGFWRGAEISDPSGLLVGDGAGMRHVKLATVDDVRPELFADWVRQAVVLNETNGDPTKRA
jgi:hypothetical protein